MGHPNYTPVLIRDSQDEDYPFFPSREEFLEHPKWRYFQFYGHELPDTLAFVTKKYYACVNWDMKEWDFTKECNNAFPNHPTLYGMDYNSWDADGKSQICHAYCELHLPTEQRAWALEVGIIPYDRILLCDELGDKYNEPPHLLVESMPDEDLFSQYLQWLEPAEGRSGEVIYNPDSAKRVSVFPTPIPDERDKYYAEIQKREERLKGKRVRE